ncbi:MULTISPECIES: Gfo/Idh/MocA family oxidoreductase [unclassified Streptomyces]|uniref:Gfo/Idh/MocA family protein n=1 Tax=unclassified Streptomyces TaxID=2593676 RepID=UPI000823F779|nr:MULTISPECIES: Gfo/Idh/MocA family oxidoreductase [unclassified Streptomyces]MYU00753.1 Gfo/Idh/MocA family oxidoreductase [Streptomyces sp. SID8350]SCK10368.1 Predicted dehydrogenase [Streptomyces sp. AmelKG-D3]
MTTPPAASTTPAPSDAAPPLRIGLLGAGPWARHTHAPALAAHPGAVLTGVWGRRAETAEALATAHGTRACTGEAGIDELLEASDAVAFALPPDVQAPLAVRAAEAGCHVLMDKPVATTVEGARAVAEAVAKAEVASVVFCTLRFAPETVAWIAEQAAVGGWFTARAQWLGSLSVLIPVLGEVTELTAARGPADTTHLILRHGSGASSTVTLGLSAPRAAAGVGIELRGEHGTAELPGWDGAQPAFRGAVDALAEAVRTGVPHACDARFGLRLTELLAEAERRAG